MLFLTLFQRAVTYLALLLACIDGLSLLSACFSSLNCLRTYTREREIFALLVARVVQKVYDKTRPFSYILLFLGVMNSIEELYNMQAKKLQPLARHKQGTSFIKECS